MHRKVMQTAAAGSAAALMLAASGMFVPAPARAAPPCAYYVNKTCERWQYLGYASWDDCIYWEMGVQCPEGAASDAGGDAAPAIRDDE